MASGPVVGPPSAGVEHINKYGKENFDGVLTCCWTENKGRIVHAAREFRQGEIILAEPPLHVVKEESRSPAFKKVEELCKVYEDDFDYEPLWYWCAIQSLTAEEVKDPKATGIAGTDVAAQRNLLLLHHEEVARPSKAASILGRELVPSADPIIIERLIQIWVLNCFEYSDDPQGYSTYFFSSFMSHSCFPNAIWHYQEDDHVLRARRDIKVGDEVCISYLTEDGLLQSAAMRRWDLHETKQFWCTCERCAGEKDFSRGFLCPKCTQGSIFSRVPVEGAARSDAMLSSDLVGTKCGSCGFKVTKKEAEKLAAHEGQMKILLDSFGNSVDEAAALKSIRDTEELMESAFVQHVLADQMCEKMAEFFFKSKRFGDHRRILEKRAKFHADAYPGLSASHAWTLEALGDALRRGGDSGAAVGSSQSGAASARGKKSARGAASTGERWLKKAKPEPERAAQLYAEAVRILTLMFGEGHEYVVGVEGKLRVMQKELLLQK